MAGRGRGRSSTLPAWMTKAGGAPASVPGARQGSPPRGGPPGPPLRGGPPGPPPPPPQHFQQQQQYRQAMPSPRKGQFDDAPDARSRAPVGPNGYGNAREMPLNGGGSRRSRSPVAAAPSWRGESRDRGRSRSRERSRGSRDGYDRRGVEAPPSSGYNGGGSSSGYERGRSDRRSRSRDRGSSSRGDDYRSSSQRYAERGYGSQPTAGADRYESYFRNSSNGGGGGGSSGGRSDSRDQRGYDYRGGSDRRERSPRRDEYYDRGYGRISGPPSGGGSGHDDRTTRNYSGYRR